MFDVTKFVVCEFTYVRTTTGHIMMHDAGLLEARSFNFNGTIARDKVQGGPGHRAFYASLYYHFTALCTDLH